ncbi:MAG TPA: PfkB family carbohydrate kinase [Candidatus Xenobia bacterium]|nr:PfkB family carbohydrate kinase [Candidatus Xenobia bacterium]
MANPSVARLRSLVRRFRGRRLAVVGDLMLDRFIRGRVARISPEAPVPVVEVNQPETQHLGGAGNVAANLAALGARPVAFGVVGRDEAGRALVRELSRRRIGAAGVVTDSARPTTVKTRIIAEHQHVVRADWEKAAPLPAAHERRLLAAFSRWARRLDGVILSDYDKGVLTESLLGGLLRVCREHKLPVFVDLKVPRPLAADVALVLVNQRRAEEISARPIQSERSLQRVGRELMARFPCSTLVITRGAQGMVVLERGRSLRVAAVRTRPWEVFDVTGAGDTVMATLALATVAGASAQEAAALANAAAGVVVGKLGTAVVTPQELLDGLTS